MQKFKVGDKVYDTVIGNGEVVRIGELIKVKFRNREGLIYYYLLDGRIRERDIRRSLYHGHDLEVIVKEKLPKESLFINLFWNKDTEKVFVDSVNYFKTEKEAREYGEVMDAYLRSVEIKV